jgi:hypothetical protein
MGGHVYVGNNMELYPNPFTSNLTISFNIKQQGNTTLSIVDATGREVKSVMGDMTPSGKYTYTVDMSDLSDGMYLAVLNKEEDVEVKRAIKTTN